MSRRSRSWTLTVQSPSPAIRRLLEKVDCEFMVGQLERAPTTGTEHFQGAIYFPTARTMTGVKRRLPRGTHLEPMAGTWKQAITYCTKLDTRVLGANGWSMMRGEQPSQGARTDIGALLTFAKEHTVLQCWEEHPVTMARNYRAMYVFNGSARQIYIF